jgi:hypothetical protein
MASPTLKSGDWGFTIQATVPNPSIELEEQDTPFIWLNLMFVKYYRRPRAWSKSRIYMDEQGSE